MEFCGIGPFRGPQSIDFDGLTASGLFLIEGPTGSGKTTIIDAIVFALYGSLSGAESDAGRLRSHLCGPDEPTEVTLTFSVNGVRHTITRNPAYERLKARGSGTTPERARQTLVVHDDATPPMREAKEIGIYLQQCLGLTVEQFRRLVVLPQGEFDALLRAKPADRYRTLASLIDDRVLERVQDELKRSADEAQQARSQSAARVEQALTLEALAALDEPARDALLRPADALLQSWPEIRLPDDEAGRFLSGLRRRVRLDDMPAVRVYGPQPRAFLGSAHITGGELIADRLLSPVEVQALLAEPSPP